MSATPDSPGIYPDVPMHVYHGEWDALHTSDAETLVSQSPLHFHQRMEDKAASEPGLSTPALKLGSAMHTAVLEPDEFTKRYLERPEVNRGNKPGKLKAQEWMRANLISICALTGTPMPEDLPDEPHKPEWSDLWAVSSECSVSPTELEICKAAQASVWRDKGLRRFFEIEGRNELSFFGFRELDDWKKPICSRKDRYIEHAAKGPLIVDLKSTENAHPDAWQREIGKRGYHRAAAWYLDLAALVTGEAHDTLAHLVFEKSPPYAAAIYILDEEYIELGRQENLAVLQLLRSCEKRGEWPGYSSVPRKITKPRWYKSPILR